MSNSVAGIGIDIIEIDRIRKSIQHWGDRFTDRVFTSAEQAHCKQRPDSFRSYAARFAAKEAVSKAFGTGIGEHLGWLDIEILADPESKAPTVQLSPRAQEWSQARGIQTVLVSLSHAREYAVAQALLIAA